MCSDGEVEDGTSADDESDERLEKRKAKVRVELCQTLSTLSMLYKFAELVLSV